MDLSGVYVYFRRFINCRRALRCALASMGGVGSTALARHLGSIADKTPREHVYSPVVYDGMSNLTLGYMFGNPYNAVLSIFRRNYQHMHAKAMNALSGTVPPDLRRVSLEEFLERGIDEFYIERQFDNWTNNPNPKHPTILIKYEELEGHIDEVLQFFGCKRPFAIKPRRSSWQEQPENIRSGLETMYGSLNEKIQAMPGIRTLVPYLTPRGVENRQLSF